jgi:hypothetical protein
LLSEEFPEEKEISCRNIKTDALNTKEPFPTLLQSLGMALYY